MKTWIKFCATTCLEDALASIEAGADAVGFVFAPSKRRVTPEQAQAIISRLPSQIERIGIFQNEAAARVRAIAEQTGLTAVQLHGEETAEFANHLFPQSFRGPRIGVIKTIVVGDNFAARLEAVCRDYSGIDSILLDSGAGGGRIFDWQKIQPLLHVRGTRLIVAGGLSPENVGEAISKFSPWGVDVVTGVERGPGRKDPEKLKAFVAAVRKAEQV